MLQPHTQVGLILAGRGNKGTQRTLQLEECSVASPLMSPCRHGLCSRAAEPREPPTYVVCGLMCRSHTLHLICIKDNVFIPSQNGQHSPGIFTGFWQLCLQAMAVQCGSPSTHWQKVQSSSFHCSSWARSLLFTQQLALVLSIDSNSTSEMKETAMDIVGLGMK